VTSSLFERSFRITSTRETELEATARSLEITGRAFYQRACALLRADAESGRLKPERYAESGLASWPAELQEFWNSGDPEQFSLAGEAGGELHYLVRRNHEALVYSASLNGVQMNALAAQITSARASVEAGRSRDLNRGFTYTFALLAAGIWALSLALLIYLTHHVTRPIRQLTAALGELAEGNLNSRVLTDRDDEIGRAIQAFNRMARQLRQSRERLVYLTQLASWQTLARKMAHEVKNSLTPIRLTVEEIVARSEVSDRVFLEQAAQIVVDEIESLERRIRAFSDFAAEPPVRAKRLDLNTAVEERVAFLKSSHPGIAYRLRLDPLCPPVHADEDLLKGILTNLLENAADAAGESGEILVATSATAAHAVIEVHDSGPGLSEQVRPSIFQPTITFKKRGMGLGLSIARKSALLQGGDVELADGELGGAAFRVTLPLEAPEPAPTQEILETHEANPHRG
jgi:nitrogen fixation/metabolism regulation signal transduction histidine kinase